jgi:putative ABC transport system permease protein
MFRNYLTITFRHLLRQKLFSFISIFGLSMSMSVSLIVLANIENALEYDTFRPQPERTYRVITHVTGKQDQIRGSAVAPLPLAGASALLQTSFVDRYTAAGIYSHICHRPAHYQLTDISWQLPPTRYIACRISILN